MSDDTAPHEMAASYERFIKVISKIDINKPDPDWAPPGTQLGTGVTGHRLESNDDVKSMESAEERHSRLLSDSLNVPESPTSGTTATEKHHKKRSIFENLKRFKSSKEALDLKPASSMDSNGPDATSPSHRGAKRSSVSVSTDGYNSEVLSPPISYGSISTNMSRASSFNIINAPPIAATSRKSAISGMFYNYLWSRSIRSADLMCL